MKLIITNKTTGIAVEGADCETLGDMLSLPEWVMLSIEAWIANDGEGTYTVHVGDGLVVFADNGIARRGTPAEELARHKLERCSDFHKDVWGYRPQLAGLMDSEIVAIYDTCSAELDRLKSTKAGRAQLIQDGWSL